MEEGTTCMCLMFRLEYNLHTPISIVLHTTYILTYARLAYNLYWPGIIELVPHITQPYKRPPSCLLVCKHLCVFRQSKKPFTFLMRYGGVQGRLVHNSEKQLTYTDHLLKVSRYIFSVLCLIRKNKHTTISFFFLQTANHPWARAILTVPEDIVCRRCFLLMPPQSRGTHTSFQRSREGVRDKRAARFSAAVLGCLNI
jgi:hypothetical protein